MNLILIAAPPGDHLHEGWVYGARWQRLLPRERDVLSFLVNGLTEFMISEILAIRSP